MKMKKTIIASFFVLCLMAASLVVLVPTVSEGSGTVHYKDVDEVIDFNGTDAGVTTINTAAGEEVCMMIDTDILAFTKSVSLRAVANEQNFFDINRSSQSFTIMIPDGVEVNLIAGKNCKDDTVKVLASANNSDLYIAGSGKLTITLEDNGYDQRSSAISIRNGLLNIYKTTVKIVAPGNTGIGFAGTTGMELVMNEANVNINGGIAVNKTFASPGSLTIYDNNNSSYKFIGTELAIRNASFADNHCTLYASTSYRGINVEDFNASSIKGYQYISTSYVGTSSFLLPLTIIFTIAAIVLFLYVFFHPSRLPWEEAIYQEERAKQKAIKDAAKAEQKKIDDAEKAEIARKRAEEKKEAEERKAIELKRREEERKVLEQKRADEKAAIQQKKEEERRLAEERRAADIKRKEAERQALEQKRAEERRAAEERKAADLKRREAERQAHEQRKAEERAAYEQSKAVERKAAEEKRAADLKRKEAERQAYEQRKAEERRAAEEKRAADLKRREEERAAYEKRKAEERRLAEEKRAAELQRREAERQAYEQRKAEERAKKK